MTENDKAELKRITNRSNMVPEDSRLVRVESETEITVCDLLDYSPFGLGVQCDRSIFPKELAVGSIVRIRLHHDGADLNLRARLASIANRNEEGREVLRLGFEIVPENYAIVGVRQGKRFFIDPSVTLKCSARDSAAAGEELNFFVKDFSAGGILLETSARNKFLFPGGKLDLRISLSPTDVVEETIIVRHIQSLETRYLVGCAFADLKEQSLERIINFYLLSSPHSELEDRKAKVKVAFDELKLKKSNAPYEVLQILSLRASASKATKSQSSVDLWKGWEEADLNSHHLMVKYKNRVIATGRILIIGKEPTAAKPLDERTMELSRVHIDPEFVDTSAYLMLWIGVVSLLVEKAVPYLVWRNSLHDLYSRLPYQLGFLPAYDQKQVGVLPLLNLITPSVSNFIAWSCVIAPILESSPSYQGESYSLKFWLAKPIRAMFLKKFVGEKHLHMRVSIKK